MPCRKTNYFIAYFDHIVCLKCHITEPPLKGCGPSSSTAVSSTLVLSNPVSSTIRFFDFMQKYKNNVFTCLPNN